MMQLTMIPPSSSCIVSGLQVNQLRTPWQNVVCPRRQFNKKIVASGAPGALQKQGISRYAAHLTNMEEKCKEESN